MTPFDITTAKSRAIHFFGYSEYEELKKTSAEYFIKNSIPIPINGVESMPEYWNSLQTIINESVNP